MVRRFPSMRPFLTVTGALALAASSTLFAIGGFTYSTLTGTAPVPANSEDGSAAVARFDGPAGIAIDASGVIYVADADNHTIRKVHTDGSVVTLAGLAGTSGPAVTGTVAGTAARFNEPWAVALSSSGTLYVADMANSAIRTVDTTTGATTTLIGGLGAGQTNGPSAVASIHEPRGLAFGPDGSLYIADYENDLIRKVVFDATTGAATVETLAGTADTPGSTDGPAASALFRGPMGVAVDSSGNVYVADTGNRAIRKITAGTLQVSTFTPRYTTPRSLTVDSSTSTLYIADYGDHTIRSLTTSGASAARVAGVGRVSGSTNGATTVATFYGPSGLAKGAGGTLYIADRENNVIRTVTAGTVATYTGRVGVSVSADGTLADAVFEDPFAVAVDATGVIYVADSAAHTIRKIEGNLVSTYAGMPGSAGSADGTGPGARFFTPTGVAVDSLGTVYVADSGNSTVRKIAAGGVVTTLAGTALTRGFSDGTGAAAQFEQPYGIAVDGSSNVYVSDARSNTIRKITSAGVVTTLAGSATGGGSTDGTGAAARFLVPYGLAASNDGTVYVVDHGNHTIRKIDKDGVVTTLAGLAGSRGTADGPGGTARFTYPGGVALASNGIVYVADTDNQRIRRIEIDGRVLTVGGSGSTGSTDGLGVAALFTNPKGIAVGPLDQLYIADRGNNRIRMGTPLP